MTTQSEGEGSDRQDTGRGDGGPGDDAEVDRRPDTAGYPTAEDAGGPGADEPSTTTDVRDRAGYPDASDAGEPD